LGYFNTNIKVDLYTKDIWGFVETQLDDGKEVGKMLKPGLNLISVICLTLR